MLPADTLIRLSCTLACAPAGSDWWALILCWGVALAYSAKIAGRPFGFRAATTLPAADCHCDLDGLCPALLRIV